MSGQIPLVEPKKRILERLSGIRSYEPLLRKVKENKEKEEGAGRRSKVYFDWGEHAIVAVDLDELETYEKAMAER